MTTTNLNQQVGRCLKLFILTIALATNINATRLERVIDSWKPVHYNVNITLNEQLTQIVSAQAQVDIDALKDLSHVVLDFGELTTDSVTLAGKPLSFQHRNGRLAISLPQAVSGGTKLSIVINYHGTPKDGLVMEADKDGRPAAVGDNWPDRVHNWIPCFDHPSAKATVRFNVTVPSRELVVANGRLEHVETNSTGTRTWSYTESVPIPPYCMIIAVGEFSKIDSSTNAIAPLSYYVPHSDAAYAPKGFAPAMQSLQLFSQTIAPYPYEKLALIIGATRFGGMENSSAIVFTSNLFDPNPSAAVSHKFGIPTGTVGVVAHEIAHQWFGDSVTESTWSDLWLSEGFATYFAGYFIQQTEGEEAFQSYMEKAAATSFAYEKQSRTPIFDRDTENLFKLLNANNYQKGAWVLHMLRYRLGDAKFFNGLRQYYEAHKDGNATTEDLRSALEQTSGESLKSFFDRWVYDSGHPNYELSWRWQASGKILRIVLRQVQPGNPFIDDVPVNIITGAGSQEIVIKPSSKYIVRNVRLKEPPHRIELDPQNTLLKEATVKNGE